MNDLLRTIQEQLDQSEANTFLERLTMRIIYIVLAAVAVGMIGMSLIYSLTNNI